MMSVQNIRPPFGERESALWALLQPRLRLLDQHQHWNSEKIIVGTERKSGGSRITREPPANYLELALNQERHDDCEQRDSFDERREDDRARLNAACHFWLTRHAVHRLTGEAADTDACSDYCDAGADAGTELRPCCRVFLVVLAAA